MGRTVLTDRDRVVRPHPHRRQPHQRRESHRSAHVVREDEERRAVRGEHRGIERDPVHDRTHRVLTDPERDVATGVRPREDARAFELGLVRLDEVGRAADHRRGEGLEGLHDLLAGIARRDVRAGREHRERLEPAVARLPDEVELALCGNVRMGGCPGGEPGLPVRSRLRPALGDTCHVRPHLVRDGERHVGIEAEHLLRRADLGLAERRTVRLRGVDRVRCAG